MSNKLTLTVQEAREILWDHCPDKFVVVEDKIADHSRWSVTHRLVIRDVETKKFYMDYYSTGATEYQDEQPWEHDEPAFIEVFETEVLVKAYLPKE